jgi:hypothetical protein
MLGFVLCFHDTTSGSSFSLLLYTDIPKVFFLAGPRMRLAWWAWVWVLMRCVGGKLKTADRLREMKCGSFDWVLLCCARVEWSHDPT